MAHSHAYGDSSTFWNTRLTELSENIDRSIAGTHATASHYNQFLDTYSNGMSSMSAKEYNSALNAASIQGGIALGLQQAPMRNITPARKADLVIRDCGWGGGDSRPRCRRYAKP